MGNDCKHVLDQATKLFFETFDTEDSLNLFVDKLIGLLIKTQDEGNSFNETEYFINQCISLSDQNFKWYFEMAWRESSRIKIYFFLGFIYLNFEKGNNEAFKLFLRASEDNYPIA